ncbi:unnamed protein product, partial [Notodromas monacha]
MRVSSLFANIGMKISTFIAIQETLWKFVILEVNCKEKVKQIIEDEEDHVELNPYIMEHCKVAAEEYCSEYLVKSAHDEDLLECLIRSKPMMNQKPKCAAAITHFQLITMKSMQFSKNFRESCLEDVRKYCRINDPTNAKRDDVINCLSEVMLEEALEDGESDHLSQKCHDELLVQLYQQEEDIDLNPDLKSACEIDMASKCSSVTEHGFGKMLECLRQNFDSLSKPCKDAIFQEDIIAAREEKVDYTLVNVCHGMINRYKCPEDELLDCLKASGMNIPSPREVYKDEPEFDQRCQEVIETRMMEHNYDYRLNPDLHKACNDDVKKFCSRLMDQHSSRHPSLLQGHVIQCLKDQMAQHPETLTQQCRNHVTVVMQEAAKDFRQNPTLRIACRETIRSQCKNKQPDEMEECLKQAFLNRTDKKKNGMIIENECKRQLENIILAAQSDIHLDPELYSVCMPYVRAFCKDVQRGDGR